MDRSEVYSRGNVRYCLAHITLEQRPAYITAFNRARSLSAVRDCAIRQEDIDASDCVVDIVQRSKNPNVVTLANLNKWRRNFCKRIMGYLDDKIAKSIKQASKNSLSRCRHIPNATVKGGLKLAGASIEFAIQIGEDDNSPTKKQKLPETNGLETIRNGRNRKQQKPR